MRTLADIPSGIDISRILTEGVVRIAESIGTGGESYHLLRREAGSEEPVVVSFGPSVQEFAERFLISCRRTAHQDRRVLWVVLPKTASLGEFLDPSMYDPEAEGEPAALLGSMPLRWATVVRRRVSLHSIRYSIDFIVPESARGLVDRLTAKLSEIDDFEMFGIGPEDSLSDPAEPV